MTNPIRRGLSSSQVSDWFTQKNTISIPSRTGKVVATGGTITTDATYRYHTFTGLGTFTVTAGGLVDILLVGSGSQGAQNSAGGAGAGGLVVQNDISISPASYTCTIPAGGNGLNTENGYQTSLFGFTAEAGAIASTRGSDNSYTSTVTPAAGVAGQGNRGGANLIRTSAGGGGGGAGSVGGTPTANATLTATTTNFQTSTPAVGSITFTTSAPHGFKVGNYVVTSGHPAGLNPATLITSVTSNTFVVSSTAIGTFVSNGTATVVIPNFGDGGVGAIYNDWGNATSTGELVLENRYYAGGGSGSVDSADNPSTRIITAISPSTPITGRTTYTTSSAHPYVVGTVVTASGNLPTAYNVSRAKITAVTSTTFTVPNTTTATASQFGTVIAVGGLAGYGGGGTAGGNSATHTNALANTGGGGGASPGAYGGYGGSGLIIVRYRL